MSYLVDTDWVVDYLTGQKAADDLFTKLLPSGIAISIVSFSEIYEGIYGSHDPNLAEAAFRAFLRQVTVLGISCGQTEWPNPRGTTPSTSSDHTAGF